MTAARITPPPVLLLLCVGAAWLADRARPLPILIAPSIVGASCFIIAAAAICIPALVIMHRRKTPIEPWLEPRHLVSNGPFAFSRNPIYVALVLIALAGALLVNSWWFVVAAAALLALLDVLIIRNEERVLARTFGAEYDAYRARVRRWL